MFSRLEREGTTVRATEGTAVEQHARVAEGYEDKLETVTVRGGDVPTWI